MSNSAYLLNTPTRVSDLAAMNGQWLIVAEARHCVPLPWLCMFGEADLRPCKIRFNHSKFVDGEKRILLSKFTILNPSTSVKAAKSNLAKALPVFEALAGDARTGARHWQAALASLETFPFEYLTIDPTEILLMDDLKAGAMEFVSAISSGDPALEARRRISGLDADAETAENAVGLRGGFLSSAWFQKCKQTPEEAKKNLELLARLDTCNLAQTEDGYEILPLDLNALNPPDRFWENAELMEKGARQLSVSHGKCTIKEGKKHYSTSLTNLSDRRLRVKMFGGFAGSQGSYVLANYTKEWFSAKDFIDWYGVSKDGWILPGETVTDSNNWGGGDDGFWAYWCENEDKERVVALAQNPQSSGAESTGHDPSDSEAPSPDPFRAAIDANIAVCRNLARELTHTEIDLDQNGVLWLDGLLEQLRTRSEPLNEGLIYAFGVYLGECIIHAAGGEWEVQGGENKDNIRVRFDDSNAVFPLNKVRKQLANGKENGDSVLGLYDVAIAMRPRLPTDWQQRLRSLYEERSDCHFFVPNESGSTPEWSKVKKIEGRWITIETASVSGRSTKPELSLPLDQISGFYATDPYGLLIDSEGFTGVPAAPVPAGTAGSGNRPRQTTSSPPDAGMEHAISRLRNSFYSSQKSLNARTFQSVCARSPYWMSPDEPLHETVNQQLLLLSEGTIVWAALIQANKLLFSPGIDDCPAQLVYSRDPYFDSRPQELRRIGRSIFKLKNTTPADQEEKAVADRITDEMDRSMGWRLPDMLTDREAYAATFMVFRRHIPNGVLSAGCFPILTHPSTQAVMIVPGEFWPIELIKSWKEEKL